MSNIVIDIAAEFTGKKAFKTADTATQKLGKSAKGLARNLGLAFGTAAVIAYSKTAIKAAAADAKGQAQLALALKNVGLARDAASAEAYVQRLQSEFGIVDDLLRPAYQKLAIATKDSAKTQKLLGIALDISASAGLSLDQVTGALSKAYLGNNVALGRLGVGISKQDLKSKSFDEITNQLATTFAGAATTSAATFSGQLALLNVATVNAAETIGGSLINALASVGDDDSMASLGSDIEGAAKSIGNLIDSVVYLKEQLNTIPGAGVLKNIAKALLFFPGKLSPQRAAELLKEIKGFQGMGNIAMTIAGKNEVKIAKENTKLTQAQTAAELAKLKAKKDQLALDKAAIALGKGKDVFDLHAIQLNAAMINTTQQLGKVTSQAQLLALTNDLARLRVKQDILVLEDAISQGDAVAATAAAKKLNVDLAILGTLSNQALKLADIKGILAQIAPKSLIDINNLNDAIAKIIELNRLQGLKVAPSGAVIPVAPIINTPAPDFPTMPKGEEWNGFINLLPDSAGTSTTTAAPIVITFNAPIYTVDSAEFAANVQKAIQNNNRFGNNLSYAGGLGN